MTDDLATRIEPHAGEPRLDTLSIFAGVAPGLYAGARRCEYRDGAVLLPAGGAPDRLLVLVRGTTSVRRDRVHIVSRSATCLLGEQALIDGRERSASVIAQGAVVVYEISAIDAAQLMADPQFLRNLNKELSSKLREATEDRAWRYRTEEVLFGSFPEHVAPEVLQELLRKGELGEPRRVEAITLFTDIRGFTAMAAAMEPERLAEDLKAFFEVAVSTVHEHGGMVDKFIGDAVMAVWGYLPHPDDPLRALRAAEDLVRRASTLTLAGEPLRIGVGVESGTTLLGVIGAPGKRQFTAIGSAVNLAARLQDETKTIGAPICVGPGLVGRLPDEERARLSEPVERDIRGVGLVSITPITVKE